MAIKTGAKTPTITELFNDIAIAINNKTGNTGTIPATEFAEEINNITAERDLETPFGKAEASYSVSLHLDTLLELLPESEKTKQATSYSGDDFYHTIPLYISMNVNDNYMRTIALSISYDPYSHTEVDISLGDDNLTSLEIPAYTEKTITYTSTVAEVLQAVIAALGTDTIVFSADSSTTFGLFEIGVGYTYDNDTRFSTAALNKIFTFVLTD